MPVETSSLSTIANAPQRKIALTTQQQFKSHRCGWGFALNALRSLHNPQGILFDGFLEMSFMWQEYQPGQIEAPYHQPWVGFLHNPPIVPSWFYYPKTVKPVFEQPAFHESLASCVGLFCLSEYHANWLRQQVKKPISALVHPTEIPELQFSYERFVDNSHKKIIQLGWFLRRLNAIYQLPIPKDNIIGYKKIKLNPNFFSDKNKRINMFCQQERQAEGITLEPAFLENTDEIDHVDNWSYDILLSENIGFIYLYDSSANNAVIECIARATPLLVNPLPAVIEHLGQDYPFYFQTISEAAKKAEDLGLIKATHQYLQDCPTRQKLSAEYFRKSFEESEVYQNIKL